MSLPTKLSSKSPAMKGLADLIEAYLEEQLQGPKQEIAGLNNRVDSIEVRLHNEGLTRTQGRSIQRAVAKRVHEVMEATGQTSAWHFSAVYGALKDRFNVPSYLDIPREKFLEVMQLIAKYDGSGRYWWREG